MRSAPELLTLQALRLAGYADEDAIADRALLRGEEVRAQLDSARREHFAETMTLGETSGWLPTERGLARLDALLAQEADPAVLGATLERFEEINGPFVETLSTWQQRTTQATSAEAVPEELLAALTAFGSALREVLADLVAIRPRFGRYPAQYDLAAGHARTEGLGWVTGIGILSCHVVWAELHQDLLSSLGRTR